MNEEISNSEIEDRFVRQYIERYRLFTQISLVVAGALFYSFFIWDKVFLTAGDDSTQIIRGLIVWPTLCIAAFLLSFPVFQKSQEIVVCFCVCFCGVMLTYIYSKMPVSINYGATGIILIVLFSCTVATFRLKYYLLSAVVVAMTYLSIHYFAIGEKNTFLNLFIANAMYVVGAVTIGGFAVWWRQREARSNIVDDIMLERQKARIEELLYSMLPKTIVERIERGESPIADAYGEVTIVFCDIVGFTELALKVGPKHLVETLNRIFGEFDRLANEHGLDRIKTIGDAYMAVGGLAGGKLRNYEDCVNAAKFAIEAQKIVAQISDDIGYPMSMRVGLHIGPIVAGVIGSKRPAFDCWGEAVNLASRLESAAGAGCILISEPAYYRLKDHFNVVLFDNVSLKGIGVKQAFLLNQE